MRDSTDFLFGLLIGALATVFFAAWVRDQGRDECDNKLPRTEKYKRPGPAELIKAFCELRTGAPVHEECQPCDTAELHLQNKRPVYPADGDA